MNNFENVIVPYWVIKLGPKFYVTGLKRKSFDHINAASYEFTNEESLAFPILLENIALDMAEKLGGIAIAKKAPSKELANLHNKSEEYSEIVWEMEQLEYINNHLRNNEKEE